MEYSKKLSFIARNLRKSRKVNSFDNNDRSESDTIAYSLLDIEEACKVLSNDLFPKLLISDDLSEDDINDILFDIGEEMRHILYHIKDTKFFNYLIDD